MRRVILHIRRKGGARTSIKLIYEVDAREPTAVHIDAVVDIGLKLLVILAAYEVPHKVAPEHIAHLVAEEVVDILQRCRLIPHATIAILYLNRRVAILGLNPISLEAVGALVPPHTWQ